MLDLLWFLNIFELFSFFCRKPSNVLSDGSKNLMLNSCCTRIRSINLKIVQRSFWNAHLHDTFSYNKIYRSNTLLYLTRLFWLIQWKFKSRYFFPISTFILHEYSRARKLVDKFSFQTHGSTDVMELQRQLIYHSNSCYFLVWACSLQRFRFPKTIVLYLVTNHFTVKTS